MDIQALIDALPATGGRIDLPAGVIELSAPLRINKPHVTLRGQGSAGFWETEGATTLKGGGIVITGGQCVLEDFLLTGCPGDGITNSAGSTTIRRVTVNHCQGSGVVTWGNAPASADLWHYESVASAFNGGDGFLWKSPASDNNLGVGTLLSASVNGGVGFNIQAGMSNEFHATLAQENKGGAYFVGQSYNYLFNCYAEEGPGSSLIIGPGVLDTHIWFGAFGQPQTIQDNSGTGANEIHYWGGKPCVNQINVAPLS